MEVRIGDRIVGHSGYEWMELMCLRCKYTRWITTERSIFQDTRVWECESVWCQGILRVTDERIAVWK